MKKIIALVLALVLSLSLVACDGNANNDDANNNDSNNDASNGDVATGTSKLGMGVVVDTSSSTDGKVDIELTAAAVVLDESGKIVSCKIDTAQNQLSVADGILGEAPEFLTKAERGDDYNMRGVSGIGKEWYEQAEAFENYVVGKTADEVAGTDAADADLLAGCTIDATAFIEATVKACNDSQANEFSGEAELSLAIISTLDSSSKDAMDGEDGSANIYSSIAAVATDSDGKILAAAYDEATPEVTFNDLGEITVSNDYTVSTKRELGNDYNMKGVSGIGKEWFEQIDAFENYVVGKTADEVTSIDTADADLLAGCTIATSGIISTVAKAASK